MTEKLHFHFHGLIFHSTSGLPKGEDVREMGKEGEREEEDESQEEKEEEKKEVFYS